VGGRGQREKRQKQTVSGEEGDPAQLTSNAKKVATSFGITWGGEEFIARMEVFWAEKEWFWDCERNQTKKSKKAAVKDAPSDLSPKPEVTY